MLLRNKKLGGIVDLIEIVRLDDLSNEFYLRLSDNEGRTFKVGFNSLAELNEEWEDYEEPKKHYEILAMGAVMERENTEDEIFRNQGQREIGNYFETKEEAEKAVEKLKAWKRLKDKGFRFKGWTIDDGLRISICTNTDEDDIYDDDKRRLKPDLDLLFGGKE